MITKSEINYVKSLLTNNLQDVKEIYKKSKLDKKTTLCCLEYLRFHNEAKRVCSR